MALEHIYRICKSKKVFQMYKLYYSIYTIYSDISTCALSVLSVAMSTASHWSFFIKLVVAPTITRVHEGLSDSLVACLHGQPNIWTLSMNNFLAVAHTDTVDGATTGLHSCISNDRIIDICGWNRTIQNRRSFIHIL